ncbi:MAG: ATP-binding domain-containing protein, partial [Lentisphaeria bacterium]|nr:ATP-binding domain-containing protein [Lentisphaeria bacterium]NQZ71005.1 ATP-binding domain-containing protein [Lentisphaeria bacterium]
NTAGHVTLMTVHAAKGLEFPLVILIAVEEKIFPHERSLMNQDIDEERRLFYVALTRAKDYLVMPRAKLRIKFNERLASQVSQFVLDIPDELIDLKKPNDLFKPASEDQVQDVFSQLYARLEE